MSWYGAHPELSRDEVRRLLPPRSCKLCVYWFSVALSNPHSWALPDKCPRCGIPQRELFENLAGIKCDPLRRQYSRPGPRSWLRSLVGLLGGPGG
jgi:hypothetical protein